MHLTSEPGISVKGWEFLQRLFFILVVKNQVLQKLKYGTIKFDFEF